MGASPWQRAFLTGADDLSAAFDHGRRQGKPARGGPPRSSSEPGGSAPSTRPAPCTIASRARRPVLNRDDPGTLGGPIGAEAQTASAAGLTVLAAFEDTRTQLIFAGAGGARCSPPIRRAGTAAQVIVTPLPRNDAIPGRQSRTSGAPRSPRSNWARRGADAARRAASRRTGPSASGTRSAGVLISSTPDRWPIGSVHLQRMVPRSWRHGPAAPRPGARLMRPRTFPARSGG